MQSEALSGDKKPRIPQQQGRHWSRAWRL